LVEHTLRKALPRLFELCSLQGRTLRNLLEKLWHERQNTRNFLEDVSMRDKTLAIGITTKDRWDDLAITLDSLRENGLHRFETIVIDDGSTKPMPRTFRGRFHWVRFHRSESSQGCIVQRNRLAELLTAELYLSLDDDSYPAPGAQLDQAAAWLTAKQDAAALTFAICSTSEVSSYMFHERQPYPVRYFIGCAHMVKRQLFLRLRGYTETLGHLYCEETDFALKAWKEGFKVYKYPSVVVIHTQSVFGRNAANANRLLTRNLIWVSAWRSPYLFFIVEVLFRVLRMFRLKTHRLHWHAVLHGYFEALAGLPKVAQFRDPVPLRSYLAWLRNPVELT
jgi:GT2 family glycosyltransferase